jgi:Terpene cyclase DEP1
MRTFYLLAAVLGAAIPAYFFLQFIQLHGLDLPKFIVSLFVNGAAGGITADLLISSFVFWAYMFQQMRAGVAIKPWLFIAINLGIGLSCALPAYLYARERIKE